MDQLCSYCQVPLTIKTPRIQCSDCPTSRHVTLCLDCFSYGVEAGAHRATHDYQVVNENNLRIFGGRNHWMSGEIELLLEAIDLFNIGNWLDISDHVATKSSSECLDFYTSYFVNGNIGRISSYGHTQQMKAKDHTDGLKESAPPHQPLQDISVQDQQDIGYMVLRDDFDQEYDGGAETEMIHLEMNMDDDDDADLAYKLFKAECYRDRLKERERRKDISKEYGILFETTSVGTKKASSARKKLTKEERELKEKLKLFARFHKNSDHEHLFQGLSKHRRLKSQLKEFQRYRKNGIKKLTDCEEFESNSLLRDKKKDTTKNSNSSSSKRDRDGNIIESKVQSSSKPFPLTLLRPGELKLCKSISLDPSSYMAIKLCILSDVHLRKNGIHTKLRFPPEMDKPKRKRMIDFFASNKWISVAGGQTGEVKVS